MLSVDFNRDLVKIKYRKLSRRPINSCQVSITLHFLRKQRSKQWRLEKIVEFYGSMDNEDCIIFTNFQFVTHARN